MVKETAQTAKRNVELNRLSERITIKCGGWDQVDQKYDLILANLVAAALLRSGDRIPHFLNKEGRAVISGFSLKQMEEMGAFSGIRLENYSSIRSGWLGTIVYGERMRD